MDNLDYGIIGNCRSAALISKTGSLDWCCLPEFDSSSVFAKLLDKKIGGSFEILVDDDYVIKQRYKKGTALLITRFTRGEDIFEVRDFMPRYLKSQTIVRQKLSGISATFQVGPNSGPNTIPGWAMPWGKPIPT